MSEDNKLFDMRLDQIASEVFRRKGKCVSCGKLLSQMVECYDHDGGIVVKGFKLKQWVYFTCPCGYESALWKVMRRIQLDEEKEKQAVDPVLKRIDDMSLDKMDTLFDGESDG